MASPSPTPVASPLPTPFPTLSPFEMVGGAPPELPIWPYLLQLMLVTLVLSAVAFYGLRYLRDKVPGLGLSLMGAGKVKVVDRVAVDQNRMVFVVNVGKRYWLLAATDAHVTPVAELAAEDVEGDFAQLVEKERRREGP